VEDKVKNAEKPTTNPNPNSRMKIPTQSQIKNQKSKILLPLCLCASVVLLAFSPGCATSYKTEKAADVTVSAAMTAWGNYVAQYHPPVAQELQVKAAFEKYQAAELLAVDATKSMFDLTATNAATAGTTNATASAVAQLKVTAATQAASQALADLIAVIQSFGVQIAAK